jgi:ubiquinone biosynthesis protein
MTKTAPHRRRHVVRRGLQIAAACAVAPLLFLREWRRVGDVDARALRATGKVLVRLCTRLGATFIKVGQIASTRGDILPRALAQELAALQDQVPPFPFSAVQATIENELGAPLHSIFTHFEAEPVAAASVAQVHRAVLRSNGATVAVKVRRPDILDKVQLDRAVLLFVARWLEWLVPSLRLISFEVAMQNFCAAVAEQTHLTNEAEHNRRFTANFADDPDVHFPSLVEEACSDAVLTMEYIDGVREADLEASGADLFGIARAGLRCVCRMVFSHGFVHADLHPGNMRFFPPRRVVLLDLGLVGSLSDADRLMTARTLFAFAMGDGRTVARLFYENAASKAVQSYRVYEAEMCSLVDSLLRRDLGNTQVTLEIGRIFDILRRHGIQARGHMTMINLALMTAEGLGKRLAPELNIAHEALPYLKEALGLQFQTPPVGAGSGRPAAQA